MLPLYVVLFILFFGILSYLYLAYRYILFQRGIKDNNIPFVQHIERKVIPLEVTSGEKANPKKEKPQSKFSHLLERSKARASSRRARKGDKFLKNPGDLKKALLLNVIFGKRKNW